MAIDGIRNHQTPVIQETRDDTRGLPSDTTSLQTASLPTGGPLLGPTSNADSSEIPGPSNLTPDQRLEQASYQLEQLRQLRERLAPLAQAGDRNAADLIAEIDRLLPNLEQEVGRLEQVLSSDIDGDGVYDAEDPDIDGDMITNQRELHDGMNPNSADSDGDGITDDNEIRLYNLGRELVRQGHVQEGQALMRRGNALSGDGDRDGILDVAQLNDEVRVQLGLTTAAGGTGGTAPSGVGTQSAGGDSSSATSNSTGEEVTSPFQNRQPESQRQTSQGIYQMSFEMTESGDHQFRMAERIGGQEARQWTINEDGDDLIVEAKNGRGELIGRFILEEANTDSIRRQLEFRLSDADTRVDSDVAVTIRGGSGDDLIYTVGGAGSQVYGGAGSDMVVIKESVDGQGALIDGGSGNDILQGGDADDRIQGGDGNDFIYGALGENILQGQDGNDAIFSAHNEAGQRTGEIVEGGTGIDLSNAYRGTVYDIETGVSGMNGLITYLNRYGAGGASPIQLEEIQRAMQNDIPAAMAMMSEGLESLALEFLVQKDLERQSWYAPLPGSQDYDLQRTPDTTANPAHEQVQAPTTDTEDDFFLDWGQ